MTRMATTSLATTIATSIVVSVSLILLIITGVESIHKTADMPPVHVNRGYANEAPTGNNCTGARDVAASHSRNCSMGPHVVRKSHNDRFDWKMKVTMACTIAAAVEITIVLFMVLYWGQIRWLLRKFACPCDETYQRSSAHEPLNRDSTVSAVASTEVESLTGQHSVRRSDSHRSQDDVTRF